MAAANNVVDPSLGVSDKADNWRVIIATENRVKTAQQISGLTPDIDQVRDPGSFSGTPNGVELGWHYYLASLDSGFVYYGCNDDECLRAVVAQSNAVRNVDAYLSNLANDTTPPTVFIPAAPSVESRRHQLRRAIRLQAHRGAPNSDFWIWTYAYDVSGITNVSLLLRDDGTNPPTSDQFKTYAGGPLAGAWQTSNMTQRVTAPVQRRHAAIHRGLLLRPGHRHLERLRGLLRQRDRRARQHLQIAHPACLGRRRDGQRWRFRRRWWSGHRFAGRHRSPEIP